MRILFVLIILVSLQASAQDFAQGEKLYAAARYADAETQFEKYLAAHPNHLKTLEYLGDIKGHEKDWEGAMGYYGKLRTLRPSEADFQYKYGGALGMHAKECNRFKALTLIDEIRSSFEKAIALDPKHINARWALIELYLQLPGIVGGSEKKAQQYAAQLMLISPIDGWLAKGRIAEYFDRFTSAESHYKKAIETGGSRTSYQKLADLYKYKMNQPEKARLTWAEFTEKNKT